MSDLFAAMEATWPAASHHQAGGWLVREGLGGGKRVSSATAAGPEAAQTIAAAIAAHQALGQRAIFSLRPEDGALDQALADHGFVLKDPVVIYEAPVAALAAEAPERLTTFAIWPPLAIMTEIWDEGQIDSARLAVMERAAVPKTTILGRIEDRAAGAAYVACHGDVAMVHALHVAPDMRRKGLARNLMRAAAGWAAAEGARRLAVAVTRDNHAANALYLAMGMREADHYHYRVK